MCCVHNLLALATALLLVRLSAMTPLHKAQPLGTKKHTQQILICLTMCCAHLFPCLTSLFCHNPQRRSQPLHAYSSARVQCHESCDLQTKTTGILDFVHLSTARGVTAACFSAQLEFIGLVDVWLQNSLVCSLARSVWLPCGVRELEVLTLAIELVCDKSTVLGTLLGPLLAVLC